ncbi:glycoside hydrolase family 127 protein [Dinghuibacter silviterrae]|nr:glycoside hydrolase family 127 protein [Dinghuibacter silviterrae]
MKKLLSTAAPLFLAAGLAAQSHYPGQHASKFAIKDALIPKVYAFDLEDVTLLDSRFTENMEREEHWIMSIPVDKLLHSFRTNAGVPSGTEGGYSEELRLGGWESLDCELRGHTTGHILSGLAMLYGTTKDDRYRSKADSLVKGLAEVQKALDQGGYLSAFPQELINRNLEGGNVWAPWYTLHKLLAGLIDQYLYDNNRQALDIAKGMGNWAYNKLKTVGPAQRAVMLKNEFGGINETFYNLYAITADTSYRWLGDLFYQNETLEPLKAGKDILAGRHANTYIPKLIGLTREYEIDGKGDGDGIARFFWETVVEHHTFATGSNSDQEHFFKADDISDHLTGYTGESCNVYNMLKLTRHLYTHTMDERYMDFYERALFNHILGQQDPKTGMIAYFLPMMAGAHKVYSTPDSSFWCCVGTGFENQAKYGESIYYHTDRGVVVNLFIPSELHGQFGLRQETDFPQTGATKLTVLTAGGDIQELLLRYPSWAVDGASIRINGKSIRIKEKPGSYIVLSRRWQTGDVIEVNFPMRLHTVPANDNPNVAAIAYGPIILAGEMGTEGFTGREPYSDPRKHNDYYTYDYHVPANIGTTLDSAKIRQTGPLTFEVKDRHLVLRPLYDIHRERYIVYWKLAR